jgi:hypothetical protein
MKHPTDLRQFSGVISTRTPQMVQINTFDGRPEHPHRPHIPLSLFPHIPFPKRDAESSDKSHVTSENSGETPTARMLSRMATTTRQNQIETQFDRIRNLSFRPGQDEKKVSAAAHFLSPEMRICPGRVLSSAGKQERNARMPRAA